MKWNYSPTWAKQPLNIINARSETLHEKPSFKNTERCIFVADGYYEWMRTNNSKTPYFHYFERDLMYFGGLYNSSSGCCIVTRESYKNISFIHHRQPVLLEEHDFDSWISKNHRYTSPATDQIKFHKVTKYFIENIQGVISFVGPKGKTPIPLREAEIKKIFGEVESK